MGQTTDPATAPVRGPQLIFIVSLLVFNPKFPSPSSSNFSGLGGLPEDLSP